MLLCTWFGFPVDSTGLGMGHFYSVCMKGCSSLEAREIQHAPGLALQISLLYCPLLPGHRAPGFTLRTTLWTSAEQGERA